MPEITPAEVKEYLKLIQGREITLADIRKEFNILPGSKSFNTIRTILFRLAESKILRPTGKKNGTYKVVTEVVPVPVFSVKREHNIPFDLTFPKDVDTKFQMDFASDVVIREGDLILISGLSNFGKTALCLNFLGENIDKNPVIMGCEYTTLVDDRFVPTPRFLNRLNAMEWVAWMDAEGNDKFTLLPVRDDYAEHIVRNKINIIDWINIDTGEHYMIGTILEGIKKQLGRGIAIIAIQKAEGATAGRGGQFTKDFADLELLIDRFGKSDVLLTVGKVKEYITPVIGHTYAYMIGKGVQILNFREVKRCPECHGTGNQKGADCELCIGNKYVDTNELQTP